MTATATTITTTEAANSHDTWFPGNLRKPAMIASVKSGTEPNPALPYRRRRMLRVARPGKTDKTLRLTRPHKTLSTTRYGSLVARKLRALRLERGWTTETLMERLRELGADEMGYPPLNASKVLSWEKGKENGGANCPVDYYPLIARVYGYKTPTGWLPDETPGPPE